MMSILKVRSTSRRILTQLDFRQNHLKEIAIVGLLILYGIQGKYSGGYTAGWRDTWEKVVLISVKLFFPSGEEDDEFEPDGQGHTAKVDKERREDETDEYLEGKNWFEDGTE